MSMPSRLDRRLLLIGGLAAAGLGCPAAAAPPCQADPKTPNTWRAMMVDGVAYSANDKGGWTPCELPPAQLPDIIVTATRRPKPAHVETSVERAYREQEARLRAQWDAYQARIGKSPHTGPQSAHSQPGNQEAPKNGPEALPLSPQEMQSKIEANGGALAIEPDPKGGAPSVVPLPPREAVAFSVAKREPRESAESRAETAKQKAIESSTRAGAKAAGLASGINLDKGDAGGAGGAPGAAPGGPAGPRSQGGPESDLLLAQSGGLTRPFKDLGLKAAQDASGRVSIRRADGGLASAAEISELKKRVGEEPLAQMGRPDFFTKVTRGQFDAVRDAYRSSPGLRDSVLKDVGATEHERDFKWSRTCNPELQGGCNPNEPQGRYVNGKYVSPEALAKMAEEAKKAGADKSKDAGDFWARLEKEDQEYRESLEREKATAASVKAPKSFGGRLSALLAAVTRAMRFGGTAPGGDVSPEGDGETDARTDGRAMNESSTLPSDVALLKSMPGLTVEHPVPAEFPRRRVLFALVVLLAALIARYAWNKRPRPRSLP